MIKYLLLLEICSELTAVCHWQPQRVYASAYHCMVGGFAASADARFSCRQAEDVRLPRPRPRP